MKYEDMTEFEQGYVEAMLWQLGDDPEFANLHIGRITKGAANCIREDCHLFSTTRAIDLEKAKALIPGDVDFHYAKEPLDDRRLGQLFWLTRQGTGVAFDDDGYADCLGRLTYTAEYLFGPVYPYASRGWLYF